MGTIMYNYVMRSLRPGWVVGAINTSAFTHQAGLGDGEWVRGAWYGLGFCHPSATIQVTTMNLTFAWILRLYSSTKQLHYLRAIRTGMTRKGALPFLYRMGTDFLRWFRNGGITW